MSPQQILRIHTKPISSMAKIRSFEAPKIYFTNFTWKVLVNFCIKELKLAKGGHRLTTFECIYTETLL